MISFIQNFICTKEARLKVINKNLPKMSEVFQDTPFYINYNSVKLPLFEEPLKLFGVYTPALF